MGVLCFSKVRSYSGVKRLENQKKKKEKNEKFPRSDAKLRSALKLIVDVVVKSGTQLKNERVYIEGKNYTNILKHYKKPPLSEFSRAGRQHPVSAGTEG